jgi:phage/plasmid-associated DNA primase
MNHCGKDLDEYIPGMPWAKNWDIRTGGDYLKAWVACMLRYPECKLPYLFMYGVQNSGKSTFHEALAELFVNKKGVARADRAMTSPNGYNGELLGAILAVVDEIDVANSGLDAYNRLKDWTTGTSLAIHAKHKTVIQVPNTLHFVQMGNSRDNLPVFQGDTRITAMCVEAPEEDIPKDLLFDKIREEAPAFLRTLLDMDIPEPIGRLRLPIIETRGKKELMASNKDMLETFLDERCFNIPGSRMKFTDFKKEFYSDMDDINKSIFTEQVVRRRLSEKGFPIGRSDGNVTCIGNLTFNEKEKPGALFVQQGKKLAREEEI